MVVPAAAADDGAGGGGAAAALQAAAAKGAALARARLTARWAAPGNPAVAALSGRRSQARPLPYAVRRAGRKLTTCSAFIPQNGLVILHVRSPTCRRRRRRYLVEAPANVCTPSHLAAAAAHVAAAAPGRFSLKARPAF